MMTNTPQDDDEDTALKASLHAAVKQLEDAKAAMRGAGYIEEPGGIWLAPDGSTSFDPR
jgi:hypothetical protein